jgi:hypothetical protein
MNANALAAARNITAGRGPTNARGVAAQRGSRLARFRATGSYA